jgi:thiol-disulfide isomerase/thioredoxin
MKPLNIVGRRALLAVVGLTGGLAGLTWFLRRAGAPLESFSGRPEALWALEFDTPAGEKLPMAGFSGRPVLINFWATWCPPCVEELPLIDVFYKNQDANGCQVLALAVDQPESVRQFLARRPVHFPVALLAGQGLQLSQQLGNTAQGLPFTVLLDAQGRISQRKIGRLYQTDLKAWGLVG